MKPKDAKSRELDTSFIDADGLKRNLLKFYWEWKWAWACTETDRKRFYKRFWDGHSFVNLIVENLRCAPYLWGHVMAVSTVIGIMITIGVQFG